MAPNFREGAGGKFDAMLKSDRTGYGTRPSDTADLFLTRPEDAADLKRIAGLRGNETVVADAARTWLFDKLARTGVAANGAIDPAKLANWRNINQGVVDTVPGLRAEIDGMISEANKGRALSRRATPPS